MYTFKALKLVKQSSFVKRFVLISFIIITVFMLLLFLPWQQTVQGIGKLTALDPMQRDYKIAATVDGFIEEFYVKENQFVKEGEKLFRIKDLDAEYQNRLIYIKEKSIQKYENELLKLTNLQKNLQSQKKVLNLSVKIYTKKQEQLANTLIALIEQNIALKNSNEIALIHYKRSQILYNDGIVSQRELEVQRSNHLMQTALYKKNISHLQNTKHALEIIKNEQKRLKYETDLKINLTKNMLLSSKNFANTLKQNIQKDATQLSRYLSSNVRAKSDGYVMKIYKNDTNRLIKRGENILYFSPFVTQRAILLKLSDFNMPLMKENLKTRIMFYGWPALQISGWPKITHGTYGGIVKSIERTSHERGAYYVLITEDIKDSSWPDNEYLKIGTQATLWVRLATVPIWYEIWRLMASQPPKLLIPSKEK